MVVTMKQMNTVFVFLLAVRLPSPKPIPKANADVNGCPLPEHNRKRHPSPTFCTCLSTFLSTLEMELHNRNSVWWLQQRLPHHRHHWVLRFWGFVHPRLYPACSCQDVADPEALPSGASSPQKPFRFLPGPSREVLSVINHIGATCFNGRGKAFTGTSHSLVTLAPAAHNEKRLSEVRKK